MSDADIHWAEYIKASTDAFILLKALYPLLPRGGNEIEANIQAAEKALQSANVTLAQMWGFKTHDCSFPPQIMLWDESIKERVCSGCGHKTNFNQKLNSGPPQKPGGPNSWMGV